MHAPERLALDRASRRRVDENGFLHVSLCHISKEAVNGYFGREIPGWETFGLDPDRVYRGYRAGSELAKGASTFNGLPLLSEHVKDSAREPRKDARIGNLGTDAKFSAPYLDNSLVIQDAEAIRALNPEGGSGLPKRELSASYRYDPVFTPGVFGGEAYDFVMTNIRGNHVALVEEGRAGPDVVVSDGKPCGLIPKDGNAPTTQRGTTMHLMEDLKKILARLAAENGEAEDGSRSGPRTDGGTGPNPATGAGTQAAAKADADALAGTKAGTVVGEDGGGDCIAQLLARLNALEDTDLAARMRAVIEDVLAEGGNGTGKEPDTKDTKDEAAALAADAVNAGVGRAVRAIRAQMDAAREVKPLIGEVADPLAFDSAAHVYAHALQVIGKPSKLTDEAALRELCLMALDARHTPRSYPVIASALADANGKSAEGNFANLGRIRTV